MTALSPHPDRLLPAEPETRAIARRLYDSIAGAPILSPHGHVEASLLLENEPFADPAALLITPDHYVTRMLHAHGVPFDRLGRSRRGSGPTVDGRAVWREFASRWALFLGTPVRNWFETELHDVFGLTEQPSAENADAQYDELCELLATDEFRPRSLFARFGIEVLATTDDPADDLAAHLALRDDPGFSGRVIPTFRADRYMSPAASGWAGQLDRLAGASGIDCGTHRGMLAALRSRREAFRAVGGTSSDTGVSDTACEPLPDADAERIHAAALAGSVTEAESTAYRRSMLYRLAEMARDDGLVMQLHAGVLRNTHQPTLDEFGPDTGHDLPAVGSFTEPLTPILRDFGADHVFRLVLFTVDETAFSREIGPLAGFYPSVFAGAPWWFLDTPAAIARYRAAVTDSAGIAKTSGFIDDTRAFCSIPARHDMSRRVDAGWLAGLVATHQLSEDDAHDAAHRLVDEIPRSTFRL